MSCRVVSCYVEGGAKALAGERITDEFATGMPVAFPSEPSPVTQLYDTRFSCMQCVRHTVIITTCRSFGDRYCKVTPARTSMKAGKEVISVELPVAVWNGENGIVNGPARPDRPPVERDPARQGKARQGRRLFTLNSRGDLIQTMEKQTNGLKCRWLLRKE